MVIWIDCFIDKFIKLHPFVKSYIALLDRWNFTPSIENDRLIYDYSAVNETEDSIFALYGLKRIRNDGWIDECLQAGNKVIIPCDSYFLPYAQDNYEKLHMFHNILVESKAGGDYYIYDDNPYYEGNIQGTIIKETYKFVNEPFEWYERQGSSFPGTHEEINFFKNSLKLESLRFGSFLYKLLNCGLGIKTKLQFISELRIPTKRFYALLRITDELYNLWLIDEIKEIGGIFLKYADDWTLITNMACKALVIGTDSFWLRIQLRINKLIEYESVVKMAFSKLVGVMPDEI